MQETYWHPDVTDLTEDKGLTTLTLTEGLGGPKEGEVPSPCTIGHDFLC